MKNSVNEFGDDPLLLMMGISIFKFYCGSAGSMEEERK
jgi:hypothetical protein